MGQTQEEMNNFLSWTSLKQSIFLSILLISPPQTDKSPSVERNSLIFLPSPRNPSPQKHDSHSCITLLNTSLFVLNINGIFWGPPRFGTTPLKYSLLTNYSKDPHLWDEPLRSIPSRNIQGPPRFRTTPVKYSLTKYSKEPHTWDDPSEEPPHEMNCLYLRSDNRWTPSWTPERRKETRLSSLVLLPLRIEKIILPISLLLLKYRSPRLLLAYSSHQHLPLPHWYDSIISPLKPHTSQFPYRLSWNCWNKNDFQTIRNHRIKDHEGIFGTVEDYLPGLDCTTINW